MPRSCTVCAHPERPAIEAALLSGQASIRDLAARFETSKTALWRHRALHSTVAAAEHIEGGEPLNELDTESGQTAHQGGTENNVKTAQQRPTEKAGTKAAGATALRTRIDQARAKVAEAEAALVSGEGQVGRLRSDAYAIAAVIEDLERQIPACTDLGALRELSRTLTERRAKMAETRTMLAAVENGIVRPAVQRLALAREEQQYLLRHIESVRASLTYEEGLVESERKALAELQRRTELSVANATPRIAALRRQLARLTGEGDPQ